MFYPTLALGLVVAVSVVASDQSSPSRLESPWVADLEQGQYKNPILHADYSDPDAIRVGDDYWMTASSFGHVPGLPILHSRDLVNWTLVTHALPRLVPEAHFQTPQHGKGVWAPALRYHDGKYYIYYPDPDFGLYLITATDPRGPWSEPTLVKGGLGLIDPCPLWDDDGRVYLIHGWAASRARVANVLTLLELSADGTKVIDDFGYVIHGDRLANYRTLEGPKLYKRDGWYYIFAPAGGVATGWQSVFRSRQIRGPYEDRITLAQGRTEINGPHQGALVDTPAGESWFLHFQDKKAYGRIVHLQPVRWRDGWPLMGTGVVTGEATGEPVLTHAKPALPVQPIRTPPSSDDFEAPELSLGWQWQANPLPGWYTLTESPGTLRLFGQANPAPENLYLAPHLLLQKFPALEFSVTTQLTVPSAQSGFDAGLLVFGFDYAWLGLRTGTNQKPALVFASSLEAAKGQPQEVKVIVPDVKGPIYLRVHVREDAECRFAYSFDGQLYHDLPESFSAKQGRWVGAKVGLFASGSGQADWPWFDVKPLHR